MAELNANRSTFLKFFLVAFIFLCKTAFFAAIYLTAIYFYVRVVNAIVENQFPFMLAET